MDTMGPLLKTLNGNQFVLVMKDSYLKLTRAIQASKTNASHIASLYFMDNWVTVIPCRITK